MHVLYRFTIYWQMYFRVLVKYLQVLFELWWLLAYLSTIFKFDPVLVIEKQFFVFIVHLYYHARVKFFIMLHSQKSKNQRQFIAQTSTHCWYRYRSCLRLMIPFWGTRKWFLLLKIIFSPPKTSNGRKF